MTFDEMEVGRVYWFRFHGGELRLGECRADSHQIYKYLRCFDGSNVELCHHVTDIEPVPTREEWEAVRRTANQAVKVLTDASCRESCPVTSNDYSIAAEKLRTAFPEDHA